MAWQREGNSRYFYLSSRDGRRRTNTYLGHGAAAALAAIAIETSRRERAVYNSQQVARDQIIKNANRPVRDACRLLKSRVGIELQRAGYYQHDRGKWRKRRVRN